MSDETEPQIELVAPDLVQEFKVTAEAMYGASDIAYAMQHIIECADHLGNSIGVPASAILAAMITQGAASATGCAGALRTDDGKAGVDAAYLERLEAVLGVSKMATRMLTEAVDTARNEVNKNGQH